MWQACTRLTDIKSQVVDWIVEATRGEIISESKCVELASFVKDGNFARRILACIQVKSMHSYFRLLFEQKPFAQHLTDDVLDSVQRITTVDQRSCEVIAKWLAQEFVKAPQALLGDSRDGMILAARSVLQKLESRSEHSGGSSADQNTTSPGIQHMNMQLQQMLDLGDSKLPRSNGTVWLLQMIVTPDEAIFHKLQTSEGTSLLLVPLLIVSTPLGSSSAYSRS